MKINNLFFIETHQRNVVSDLSCRCSSVSVHQPGPPEQHRAEHRLDLHQPLQQRACSEQRDCSVALRPAQLHLRCPVPITGHPIQYRLRWTPHLRRVLPAVQHSEVCHLDGKTLVNQREQTKEPKLIRFLLLLLFLCYILKMCF